ncbi:unnamed protein product [Linum tenue]|uniref:Poly(A) RNA polymerase mitochondrial-like central palm domain-containing protein n=1 Tax=Linum tenue TaxID=586396 RepID=A0AAV0JQD0_9ROSI|nr:unnamed protein product [Linum tenue]
MFLQTKMNAPLESTLWDILGVIEPQRDDWLIRQRIVQELQDVVRTIPNLRGATVEPFGSFVSNLFTPWGDLDITVMLDYGSYISVAGKKRKLSLLEDVLRALKEKDAVALHHHMYLFGWLFLFLQFKCVQTCKPAIFPPLLALYPTNALDDLTGVRETAEQSISDLFHANIRKHIAGRSRTMNRSSLSELFVSFLAKVEDPFEQPANSARAVSVRNLDRIQEVIQRTQLAILSPNLSWIDIHPLLVKPELSRVILFRKQNQNSGGQMMQLQQQQQPQTRKHVHSPAPVIAARVQNVRPENQLRGWRDGTCHIHELSSKPKQETASNNAVSKESNAKKWRKRGIQQQQRGDVFNSKQQLWRPRSQQS